MSVMASQITSLMVDTTVYSDADQRKHQSSASLAYVRGIHRGPVNSPHKWPVTRKMFPFDDVIMYKGRTSRTSNSQLISSVYHLQRWAMRYLWWVFGENWPLQPGGTTCRDMSWFNTLHAIFFFRENINIYLHFMSFLHTNKTQVVEIPPRVRQGPAYFTSSISWLLMSWRRKEPGH